MRQPFSSPPTQGPVNQVPPAVVVLFLAIIGVEGLFALGQAGLIGGPAAVGWRLAALQDYAYFPAFLDFMMQTGQVSLNALKRFVTYPFVHASFMNAVVAAVMLLAIGKFVGEVMHGAALIALFFISAIVGALVFSLFAPAQMPLYGAYPSAYGFIGAYSYMLWVYLRHAGERQVTAFRMIGVLMGIQLLFSLFFDVGMMWVAELAGFVTGFALAPVLLPGGLSRLRAKLQRR